MDYIMRYLVTGGAGFIGSAVIRLIIKSKDYHVVNLDKLTYAGNLDSLYEISKNKRYSFEQVDICNGPALARVFKKYKPNVVMHLAAESHVDRSIDGPAAFINTNILGTFNLLDVARNYYKSLSGIDKKRFRFHHISTDEVYGDLAETDDLFTEETSYSPSSPYSASKAASDHLVRAWGRTYGLPVIITNCSNNYGPFQYPEKLIPLVIKKCLTKKKIPIYGNGKQIRNWLHVDDHCEAILAIIKNGVIGNKYNIGSDLEINNLNLINKICKLLNNFQPNIKFDYKSLKTFVADRPSHDTRYSINYIKIYKELGWKPRIPFEEGIESTVKWYLNNEDWIK